MKNFVLKLDSVSIKLQSAYGFTVALALARPEKMPLTLYFGYNMQAIGL